MIPTLQMCKLLFRKVRCHCKYSGGKLSWGKSERDGGSWMCCDTCESPFLGDSQGGTWWGSRAGLTKQDPRGDGAQGIMSLSPKQTGTGSNLGSATYPFHNNLG